MSSCLIVKKSKWVFTAPIESLLCNIPTVIAGYPAVTMDLNGTCGFFPCKPDLPEMLAALEKAWQCPKYDSTELSKKYHSGIIGQYAYNIMSKLTIS